MVVRAHVVTVTYLKRYNQQQKKKEGVNARCISVCTLLALTPEVPLFVVLLSAILGTGFIVCVTCVLSLSHLFLLLLFSFLSTALGLGGNL